MESLLVISNESALAETLASELPEFAITAARANDADHYLHKENFSLIIIDSDTNYPIDTTIKNSVKLTRPIRLSDAIYTISQQLKSKTTSAKEEIEIAGVCNFSPAERLLRPINGATHVTLTEKEVELLQYLVENKKETLSREALLKNIWGYGDDINTHTLETHIYRLRGKLKQLDETLDIVFSEESGYRIQKN